MKLRAFIFAAALVPLAFLGACSKKPAPLPALSSADVRGELATIPTVLDDDRYSPIDHAWLEKALERHLAKTWHDRPYKPELKDCDDFTDFCVANVRHWFGEEAPEGSGAALAGRFDVFIAEAGAWHRIGIFRTERGWFVADPQALIPRPWRIPLIPLAQYGRPSRKAAF